MHGCFLYRKTKCNRAIHCSSSLDRTSKARKRATTVPLSHLLSFISFRSFMKIDCACHEQIRLSSIFQFPFFQSFRSLLLNNPIAYDDQCHFWLQNVYMEFGKAEEHEQSHRRKPDPEQNLQIPRRERHLQHRINHHFIKNVTFENFISVPILYKGGEGSIIELHIWKS